MPKGLKKVPYKAPAGVRRMEELKAKGLPFHDAVAQVLKETK